MYLVGLMNEAENPKNSLAKKFIDFAISQRPYLRLLLEDLTLYYNKVCGQTTHYDLISTAHNMEESAFHKRKQHNITLNSISMNLLHSSF